MLWVVLFFSLALLFAERFIYALGIILDVGDQLLQFA